MDVLKMARVEDAIKADWMTSTESEDMQTPAPFREIHPIICKPMSKQLANALQLA